MDLTFPKFDANELMLLKECLDSKWVTQGPMTERLEACMREKHQAQYALATTSCTAALHLSMLALGIGPGDEVLVPAFTWVTSAHCAEYVGARAVFVDVTQETFNIDPGLLESAITPRTRAIVAVHLFGLAAEMDRIREIAQRHELAIVEDAACAIGTTYYGKPVGTLGDVGCFSFHPRKIITTGEGGMLTCNDELLATRIRSLRNHGATGMSTDDDEPAGPWTMATFNTLGFNLRLSDIQAAVGVAQFGKLDALLEERRARAVRYTESLDGVGDVQLPVAGDCAGHSYQSYVIRVREGGRARRNKIMGSLVNEGIATRPGTHAVHSLGYYINKYGISPRDFPVAEDCAGTTITLPLFPGYTDEQQDFVIASLREALSRC